MPAEMPPPLPSAPPLNPYAAPQAVVADFVSTDSVVLAGRGMRLAGAMIDTLLLVMLVLPMMVAGGYFQMAMRGE